MYQKQQAILIVDDIPQNIKVLGSLLRKEGFDVEFALNGQDAIRWVNDKAFDLILLDIMMPGMDGYEVCKLLKENTKTSEIPIIFLTAKTDSESIVKGFKAGAVDYLTKPFGADEMLARVHTRLELRSQRRQLQELNATKDKFFAIISHDLMNPFNTLLGFTDIINSQFDELSDDEKKNIIQLIHEGAKSGHKLLSELLEWSRLNMKEVAFNPKALDLNAIVKTVLDVTSNFYTQKQITPIIDIPEFTTISADFDMLKIILRNLITNAIKFTPNHGTITIKSKLSESFIHIHIIDTGVGINEEHRENLFSMKHSYSSIGTNGEKGTGLGLILTSDFIKRHNGTIEVISTLGKGTNFIIGFPLIKA